MTKTFRAAVTLCAVLAGMLKGGNIVVNGGFETGDFTGWTLSGNTESTGVDNEEPYGSEFGAYFGAQGSLGYLSQVLSTVPGDTYSLSYWIQNDGGPPDEFLVSWNGSVLSDTVNAGPFSYTEFIFNDLLATSDSTTLEFGFRQDSSFLDLDDVVVTMDSQTTTATPEPSTQLLVGFGSAISFLLLRRKVLQARFRRCAPPLRRADRSLSRLLRLATRVSHP